MTQYFNLHPDNPQPRLLKQAAEALSKGALIIYPTDSSYALGCTLDNKSAVETIRTLRKLQPKHPLTLIASDIAHAAEYGVINDQAYYFIKRLTPGPYTFILPATKKVPKLIVGTKRKVVGIRIPDNPVALGLVESLGEPILSTSLILPEDFGPVHDPHEVPKDVLGRVDLVLDVGLCKPELTTVVEIVGNETNIIREGAGDVSLFKV